ncbi:hypothetical protein ACQ4PT_030020 [Festuca glaucescens]
MGSQAPTSPVREEEPVPTRRRQPGQDAPNYSLWRGKFSIELHHGGFFCGLGSNRCYLEEKVDWFDDCAAKTWSQMSIDYMLNTCGYPSSSMEHVYWLQPGKTLADGLNFVIFQRHAKEMADASKLVKNLVLYVDHVHLLKTQAIADDVVFTCSPLPKVVSPVSPLNERKKRNTGSDDAIAGEGSGSDTDLFDSDYDMEDDEQGSDDDDFQNAVDDDVEDEMIKQELKEGVWADAPIEDEELQLPVDEDGYII